MSTLNSVFVTGTDTDAGKTIVSAAIIQALVSQGIKTVGLKPIASGFECIDGQWRNSDVDALTYASNVDLPERVINRYSFKPAIAPHIAASQANQCLEFDAIKCDVELAQKQAEFVLVEGVGGWHVPLSDINKKPVKDIESLALNLEIPIVLVVGLRLGCINHAVLTANAILNSGLPFLGWVANHVDSEFACVQENLASLEALIKVPKLFDLPYLEEGLSFDITSIAKTEFIQSLCKK